VPSASPAQSAGTAYQITSSHLSFDCFKRQLKTFLFWPYCATLANTFVDTLYKCNFLFDLIWFVWYKIQVCTELYSVLSQCTRLTDRQTDIILIAIPRLHFMQRGKNRCNKLRHVYCTLYMQSQFAWTIKKMY